MSAIYLGVTNFRYKKRRFCIQENDRLFHTYILGKTGSGKTTLLQNMIFQDIDNGNGACYIDPHGDSCAHIIASLSTKHKRDVIYLDLTNPKLELGYNPFRKVTSHKRSLICGAILDVFQREWSQGWGPRLEHILRNCILTLLDQPMADFSSINKLLLDEEFRNNCKRHIENKDILKFWNDEFPKYRSSDLLPLLSKTSAFLSHSIIKRILVENKKCISIRQIMDNRKILLINLAKGNLGSDVANTLGGLLLTTIASATFSRIDTPEKLRAPFHLYIDEFQSITDEKLSAELLSEARKFRLGLVLSHQNLTQLNPIVRASILGNAGTIICFRLSFVDAKIMCQEFDLFKARDYTNLPQGSVYLRLTINGQPSKTFSANTLYYPIRSP